MLALMLATQLSQHTWEEDRTARGGRRVRHGKLRDETQSPTEMKSTQTPSSVVFGKRLTQSKAGQLTSPPSRKVRASIPKPPSNLPESGNTPKSARLHSESNLPLLNKHFRIPVLTSLLVKSLKMIVVQQRESGVHVGVRHQKPAFETVSVS
ncbi:uncharacterized protein LOC119018624 [Acanthopagrus latus]|uniref:uncharacterized protein LOC119018624 n=1 Tax=Acanthopagrus latus TaxID=8177 RepID=UPI00187C449E|nr:uncharacterized protein LOC119018624 [Acanthopagrus latus]